MALCLIGQAVLFRLVFVPCLLHKSALPSAQMCHAYGIIVHSLWQSEDLPILSVVLLHRKSA
ncbi:hypothetical protein HMPREF1212_00870 [Parabacteroides sp. HGS0025]|uniref:Uncharacterized protein n=1 Tax=Parabacteroides gordonii MS-1 = DSM 23371 TaxID=1203610 RepID=A0A0F5JE96_9BACT|nr:hypothetical protein HMPREF1212_00870 [Parabacteroides sp. HGS0025]KKB55787.1 hypothetical protein HMPREF1536_03262 [Parabacteroides gordonii MS-1 = DSM 23371]